MHGHWENWKLFNILSHTVILRFKLLAHSGFVLFYQFSPHKDSTSWKKKSILSNKYFQISDFVIVPKNCYLNFHLKIVPYEVSTFSVCQTLIPGTSVMHLWYCSGHLNSCKNEFCKFTKSCHLKASNMLKL